MIPKFSFKSLLKIFKRPQTEKRQKKLEISKLYTSFELTISSGIIYQFYLNFSHFEIQNYQTLDGETTKTKVVALDLS